MSATASPADRLDADIDAFLADMNKREAASRQALIDRILALSPEGRRAAADQALEFLIASVRGKDQADATFLLLMVAGAGEYAQGRGL